LHEWHSRFEVQYPRFSTGNALRNFKSPFSFRLMRQFKFKTALPVKQWPWGISTAIFSDNLSPFPFLAILPRTQV